MNTYVRLCPNCGEETFHKSESGLKQATRLNKPCRKCTYESLTFPRQEEYKRECPTCDDVISYSDIYIFNQANKKKTKCYSCGRKSEKNKAHIKNLIKNNKGKSGSFFGKKHSDESKEKQSKIKIGKYAGDKNPMSGKTVKSIWIEKYGLEEAERLTEELRKKQSINSSGENNPMFGKPSPQGSGNGWSGWFKGNYFRSLLELTFMVENEGKFISGESKKYKIEYEIDGEKKNYFPDFVIGNIIYEVKPKNLWNSFTNKIKFEAAEKWCKENNFIFEIVEPVKISFEEIKKMYKKQTITFIERYKQKLLLWDCV